jgi:hypothetical protein
VLAAGLFGDVPEMHEKEPEFGGSPLLQQGGATLQRCGKALEFQYSTPVKRAITFLGRVIWFFAGMTLRDLRSGSCEEIDLAEFSRFQF